MSSRNKQPITGVATAVLEKLSILLEINQAVSRNLNLYESLPSTLKILQHSDKIKSGAVFLADSEEKQLELAASIGYRSDVAKAKHKLSEGLTSRIAETGKPIIVSKVGQ